MSILLHSVDQNKSQTKPRNEEIDKAVKSYIQQEAHSRYHFKAFKLKIIIITSLQLSVYRKYEE